MSHTNEFKVGIFVIASTALGFGAVVALGSGKLFVPRTTIETATTRSVDGLKIGSPVKYRGVPVGEVTEVTFVSSRYSDPSAVFDANADDDGDHLPEFDFTSPVLIRMEIRLDQFGKQADYFARSINTGVLGGLRVQLRKGFVPPDMHVELDVLDPIDAEKRTEERLALYPAQCEPEYPYIPTAKTSDFDSLLDGAQQFLASLREVDFKRLGERAEKALASVDALAGDKAEPLIGEAEAFLREIRESNRRLQEILARKEIDETIQNLGALTTDVRGFVTDSKDDLRKAIAELPATIAAVEGAASRLEALVDSEPVRESLRNIEAASKELKPLFGEYKALGEDLSDLVASEEADIRRLVASLRQLVQNLESFSGRLRQDPPHVLFGPPPAKLPPGEPSK